jgi:hypothetical protein
MDSNNATIPPIENLADLPLDLPLLWIIQTFLLFMIYTIHKIGWMWLMTQLIMSLKMPTSTTHKT